MKARVGFAGPGGAAVIEVEDGYSAGNKILRDAIKARRSVQTRSPLYLDSYGPIVDFLLSTSALKADAYFE